MQIQKKKAEDQGIEFEALFKGIAQDSNLVSPLLDNPVVMSDEDRVK